MPMTWNETNDAKLLVGILTTTNVKIDMHALANFMGPGCTVSAVQHRIQRLKDKVSTSTPGGTASSPVTTATTSTTMTSPGNETPTTPTPATPEKRKRGRPRKNPVVGGGEASTSTTVSSAKKPKAKRAKKADGTATATATAAVVKNEEVSDEEEEVLPETPGAEEGGVGEGDGAGGEEVQESPVVKGEEEDDA
ncbi:hypothetical protein BO79DRAFT_215300 [Aspergillus costaricaensis CBS 115574]|uniref:Uncharacterized protein n=1 Tax=Aspergillus costaricaensis CBS 115574 TaxID=1448317 RepID=A0ACD1IML4_9EURO|nr:hypothetical protein BO79DRAFT_215300 [Aspergillus costaricaensis CBS 115574]RAK91614.1 hypothetical protein BO79DRAFT_215300 [Aspergillus costaricaensis CBS 115574]